MRLLIFGMFVDSCVYANGNEWDGRWRMMILQRGMDGREGAVGALKSLEGEICGLGMEGEGGGAVVCVL